MGNKRIYYWDNLKAILIFLVVLGHFLSPVAGENKYVQYLYFIIYLFHIPAFVFATGYFSKSYVDNKESRIRKLIGYLILFYVYKILLWVTKSIMLGKLAKFKPLSEEAAPWYMLSLFCWLLILPMFAKLKPIIGMGITLILALLVGMVSQVGEFLCLSRTIVFLPFFLAGYYFKEEWIEKLKIVKIKFISVLTLLCVCVWILFNMDIMNQFGLTMFGSHSYVELKTTIGLALLARCVWIALAMIILLSVMSLVPKRKTIISYIGQRTLAIYILHRVIRQVFTTLDLYRYFDVNGLTLLVGCIMVSALITWVCSFKIFDKLFRLAFKIAPQKSFEKNKNINKIQI